MKNINLLKQGGLKIREMNYDLLQRDVEEIPKSCIPGEWVILSNSKFELYYLAYVNTIVEAPNPQIRVVQEVDKREAGSFLKGEESEVAREKIAILIKQSIERRRYFSAFDGGARLVYGAQDFLPGLIVDEYRKVVLVQINTAGLDRFRDLIKELLTEYCPGKRVILFDNEAYRKNEVLPSFQTEVLQEDLDISENGLELTVPAGVIQKIGYYYDHRSNRKRLENLLQGLSKSLTSGIDLFSYVGSWGLHMLRAGVKRVDFVDQGDFAKAIDINLEQNGFGGKGEFHRVDVFKFVDQLVRDGKTYDVVCSDPPSFSKSSKTKNTALQGYSRLHGKLLDLVAPSGVLVVASCTKYVNFEELSGTVFDAAIKKRKVIRLVDMGLQAADHPMRDLRDKANYIKYLAYIVE